MGGGTRPGWLLDERASAGAENLDPAHVERYDRKMDAGALAEVELLRSLGLDETSTVVDFGPGTGQFVLAAAPVCRSVIAVDVSEPMRAALARNVATAGLDNVEIVPAGFLTYDHRDRPPADFVYSRYALHHLPDFWKSVALMKIAAILRPGGLFRLWDVVYSFPPQEAEQWIEAWCATAGDDHLAAFSREEHEDHVRDEHSTYTWLLEPMLRVAGFTILDSSFTDDGIFAKYVLRARGE